MSSPPASSTPTDARSSFSASPNIASANYFFGFIITFVILLLIFVGCGVGRRRVARIGSAWDVRLDSEHDTLYGVGRRRGRRKLVPPVFWETWLSLPTSTEKAASTGWSEWPSIQVWGLLHPHLVSSDNSFYQPISVCLIRTCRSQAACNTAPAAGVSESAAQEPNFARSLTSDSQSSSSSPSPPRRRFAFPLLHPFNNRLWPRRRLRARHSSADKSKEVDIGNSPEGVKIAVMICMPSPAFRCNNNGEGSSCRPARPDNTLREYQIGVAQVPWTFGERGTRC